MRRYKAQASGREGGDPASRLDPLSRWTKVGGRKGYLAYIDQFFPKASEETPE